MNYNIPTVDRRTILQGTKRLAAIYAGITISLALGLTLVFAGLAPVTQGIEVVSLGEYLQSAVQIVVLYSTAPLPAVVFVTLFTFSSTARQFQSRRGTVVVAIAIYLLINAGLLIGFLVSPEFSYLDPSQFATALFLLTFASAWLPAILITLILRRLSS